MEAQDFLEGSSQCPIIISFPIAAGVELQALSLWAFQKVVSSCTPLICCVLCWSLEISCAVCPSQVCCPMNSGCLGPRTFNSVQLIHSTGSVSVFPPGAGPENFFKAASWSDGEENGNLPQYSYLGNPKDRGARGATVHRVAKSQTWLSNQTTTKLEWLQGSHLLFPTFRRSLSFVAWCLVSCICCLFILSGFGGCFR